MALSGSNFFNVITGGLLGAMTGGGQQEEPAQVASTETAAETISKSQQTATAATTAKKRAAARSRSVYSSPLGISGEASTVNKTLLGQ